MVENQNEKTIHMNERIPERLRTVPAQSEQFGDFIIKYSQFPLQWNEMGEDSFFEIIDASYGVLYVPLEKIGKIEVTSESYNSIPKCYTYMDIQGLNKSEIDKLQNHPYLHLEGAGVAIAIIDSGIDYKNPVFQNENGSRIQWFWDQTVEVEQSKGVPYGKVFTKEDFDKALQGEQIPFLYETDGNGHGTAMAAVAAGGKMLQDDFSGAAPQADIFVVKLKKAKKYLREFYLISKEIDLFQENDIMMGLAYVLKAAREAAIPISIGIGLGSNQGAHIGKTPLCRYISGISELSNVSISVAVGNEGAAKHHYYGKVTEENAEIEAEIIVGKNETGFTMELWASPPGAYHFSLQSPAGEVLEISSSLGSVEQMLHYVFTETRVFVNYISMERQTGNLLLYFRFIRPAEGIWKVVISKDKRNESEGIEDQGIHIWLPVQGIVSLETFFLESSPYTTITSPADSSGCIACTAYQYRDNSLYLDAGRGFLPNGSIAPQLAAPGVDMRVPGVAGRYYNASGTSLAAAQTAGAAALLLEWAIVRENDKFFAGERVLHYLRRGAVRERNQTYPNRDWGYGKLDLYRTFTFLE